MPWITWFWPGHSTFFSSATHSLTKRQARWKMLPRVPSPAGRAAGGCGLGRASGRSGAATEIGFARHG